jgi:ArsR family transcriptional regulator
MPPTAPPSLARRAAVLKALAHPSRLLITEALMAGELCVCDLRALVGDDVSTVSKHLSILRSAGVLVSEKRGLNVYYRLSCNCFGDFLNCVDQVSPDSASLPKPLHNCC